MIVKTKGELEVLREGGRRLARHVRTICEMVRPGVTPKQLEERARAMVESDGDTLAFYGYGGKRDIPFPAGLCISVNDVIVHCPASESDAAFEDGDIVCVDFGIKHDGLFTDHAVTVIAASEERSVRALSHTSSERRRKKRLLPIIAGVPKGKDDERLLSGTREALRDGIKAARVGNTIGHIGEAVERVAKKYNFGFPKNLGGHGVGRAVHEEPHIHNFGKGGEGAPIVENMVLAIEPMMTLGSGELVLDADGHSYRTRDGSRTAHFEHTVLITKNGAEILTKE